MSTMSRRKMILGMGWALAGGLSASALAQPGSEQKDGRGRRRPNMIFILADDLGYGDLGCFGQQCIRTPRLDAMAEEGIRFTQCYAGSTVCAPSRCCLMTGLHTGHAHVRGNKLVALRENDRTVAEVLRNAGYRTGLVGKWGLGEPGTTGLPNRQGFDYFFGYLNQGRAHNYYPDYLWRNEQKVLLRNRVDPEDPMVATERLDYSHDLFTQEALDFVRREKEHPFFLYLAYTIPHANNERGRALGDGMEVPDYGAYAEEDWPETRKGFAAMVSRMDRDVGVLLDLLKELGLDEETIVFFTSDNGPHREGGYDPGFFRGSGPLRGIKRDLYEGGIRVPMIVRWPGQVPAGATSGAPWAFWDFLPTAAELAGSPPPSGIDGKSIWPLLQGAESQDHDPFYWEFHEGGFKQAVRLGRWKGVRLAPETPIELYDLRKDVGETRNVAGNHPDVVERIEAFLATVRTDSADWPVP